MNTKVILLLSLVFLGGIVAESCPKHVKEGERAQITLTLEQLEGPLELRRDNGGSNISCENCDYPCLIPADTKPYRCVAENKNGNYSILFNITSVSLLNDATTWRWFDNNTELGECKLRVYSFENSPECSSIELDESGSKVKWSCKVSRVYPKPRCVVEYENNQTYTVQSKYITTTHTNHSSSTAHYDSVCTMEIPTTALVGKHSFQMGFSLDIIDGTSLMQQVRSDDVVIAHSPPQIVKEESDGLDIGAIVGITLTLGILFCIACFVLGYLVAKRRIENNTSTAPGYIASYDLTMDTNDKSEKSDYKTQTLNQPTIATKPAKGTQSSKIQNQLQQQKQTPQQQQQQEEDIYLDPVGSIDLYVNQSDLGCNIQADNNAENPDQVYEQPDSCKIDKYPNSPDRKSNSDRKAKTNTNSVPSHDLPKAKNRKNQMKISKQESKDSKESPDLYETFGDSSKSQKEPIHEPFGTCPTGAGKDQDGVYDSPPSRDAPKPPDQSYMEDEYLQPDELSFHNGQRSSALKQEHDFNTQSSDGYSHNGTEGEEYETPQSLLKGQNSLEDNMNDLYLNTEQAVGYYNT